MTTTDIKKSLYKNKPTAKFVNVGKSGIIYNCDYTDESKIIDVSFAIPLNDLGDAKFYCEMNAHELIRWIDTYSVD